MPPSLRSRVKKVATAPPVEVPRVATPVLEYSPKLHALGIYQECSLGLDEDDTAVIITSNNHTATHNWMFNSLWKKSEMPMLTFIESLQSDICCICNKKAVASEIPKKAGGGRVKLTTPTVCGGNCTLQLLDEIDLRTTILHNSESLDFSLHLIVAAMHSERTGFLGIGDSGHSKNDLEKLFQDMVPGIATMQTSAISTKEHWLKYLNRLGIRRALSWAVLRSGATQWKRHTMKETIDKSSDMSKLLLNKCVKALSGYKRVSVYSIVRETPLTGFSGRYLHGSSIYNWFSISQVGLRSLSGTGYMSAGAALGPGVYCSNCPATAFAYSNGGDKKINGWSKASVGILANAYAICHGRNSKNPYDSIGYNVIAKHEDIAVSSLIVFA